MCELRSHPGGLDVAAELLDVGAAFLRIENALFDAPRALALLPPDLLALGAGVRLFFFTLLFDLREEPQPRGTAVDRLRSRILNRHAGPCRYVPQRHRGGD